MRDNIPRPPARVVEIGCGPLGGFVPELRAHGYDAVGVDPEAPEEPGYERTEFERYDGVDEVDAVVACTSLHHVADLDGVLVKARAMLAPRGVVVVVEWARERFDEATVRWCFDRLQPSDTGSDHEHGWLRERQAEWLASGEPWDAYLDHWARQEGMHTGQEILRQLDARFVGRRLENGPYFFPDLHEVTEADEQAAIDAGLVRATRIQYVGTVR
ncbi:MAG TPA: methyltransferase domain-containing protein [Nocardioides sp.]|uniref:class I SAM-dependent methyltransferase n=1 Tax=Nocardioides sp. TaxID=35761 RepID=UPI002F42A8F1